MSIGKCWGYLEFGFMPSPFILCHHLSRLHHWTVSYFRVGPRVSPPCNHPLFCVLIIWVTFITEYFFILELVVVRVLHDLTLYSVSSSESPSSPNISLFESWSPCEFSMTSPFILCPYHLSRLHHRTFPYLRVGLRASSPWPHPLFCVLIIWVAFITEQFLILELVSVRVLHALTLYSVSLSSESPSSPNSSLF